MAKDEANEAKQKPHFTFCPQCGHKGLYHIHQQYYRCRYCGTYLISSPDKDDPTKPG